MIDPVNSEDMAEAATAEELAVMFTALFRPCDPSESVECDYQFS